MRRDDLAALSAEALAALTNRGLVRRAARELREGPRPALSLEADGALVARLGDLVSRVPAAASVLDGECSCGARGVCRHLVMAVLAYLEEAGPGSAEEGSPAEIADDALKRALGAVAYRRARRARDAGYEATVLRAPGAPAVELETCTVRFLTPRDLRYARCDCRAVRACAHMAMAVWAIRVADRTHADAPRATVEVGATTRPDARALDGAIGVARELLTHGVDGRARPFAARLEREVERLRAASLRWPAAAAEALRETLVAYDARRAEYRAERVGELLVELHARARASAAPGDLPAPTILGLGEADETALDDVRLVSLGARVRAGDAPGDARVDVYLADPSAAHVLVLRRRFEAAGGLGASLARRAIAPGISLGALARGQMVTRRAARLPDREVRLRRGARAETSVTPQLGRWDQLGPALCAPDAAALRAQLDARPPWPLRPRVRADAVRVFPIHAVGKESYTAADQTLRAELLDPTGGRVVMELEHAPARGRAIDAAVEALRSGPRFVSGHVRRASAGLTLAPIAFVTDRVVVLDLEPTEPQRAPRGAPVRADDPLLAALVDARRALDDAAHRGLGSLSRRERGELGARATRLSDVGLGRCAARLRAVGEDATPAAWFDASLRVRLAIELSSQVGSSERS